MSINITFIYNYDNVRTKRAGNVNIHKRGYEGSINHKSQVHYFKLNGNKNSLEREVYLFLKTERLLRNRKFDETRINYGDNLGGLIILKRYELPAPKIENLKRIAAHIGYRFRKRMRDNNFKK